MKSQPTKPKRKPRRLAEQQPPDPGALLYTRRQTAKKLSCSIMKVIRLENAGVLRKVRLPPGPTGKVFNTAADVQALVDGSGQ